MASLASLSDGPVGKIWVELDAEAHFEWRLLAFWL